MYNIWNFPFSICTLSQQKSYNSKGIPPIFEIFATARRCWGWAIWWKISGAQLFYICNGKLKSLRIDNIWNFATFNLYTVPAKILYLQRYSSDFRNLCHSSNILTLGIWVESFKRAGILLLQWKVKTLRIDNIWNFATFNLYTVPEKILYLQRYSTDFRNVCLSSKMLREGIWVERFRRAAILLLQWPGENFAHVQHLKFPTFNQYTVTAKILYPQRYSTHFRNLCLRSKMLREGIWVESFRRAGILLLQWQGENFAHLQHLKFPTFNLYTVPAKILYLQRYSTDFRNLCISSTMLRVGIWAKRLRRAAILLLQWKVKTLRIDNIWNFATFKLYTVPAKILHLQRYSTDFRNLCLSKETLRVGIWVESLKRAAILLLQWQGENFAIYNIWNFPLSTCTMCLQKSYISKGFPPIFEIFASARRLWGRAFGWKDSGAQLFYFYNGQVKILRMYNIWNFPLSISTLSRQKSYIPKGIQPIFEIFASARRCWGRAFGWKVSGAQVFYFCNGKVKTLRIYNIWNFPLSTCTLCLQKSYISKGIQPIFEIFASARRCWGWAFGRKDWGAQLFYFCNGKWKLCASTTFEILPLSNCTLCLQKSYISKGIPPIFEIFASARRLRGWAFGWKVWSAQLFYFCNGKVKTLPSTTFEISHFQPVQCACKNPISPKVFHRFSKSLPQQGDFEGGHLGGKFEARRYFTFEMARWKLCVSTPFEILPLSTCTLCQQKSYISKGIQPIFEIFASARRLWGWAFGWKVSGAQVFYFGNGKVKTLRMYNIWNFPISSCTLCLQKSYISKGIQPIFEIFATARRFWGRAFGWKVSSAQVWYFCNGKEKILRMYNNWNFPLSTCILRQQKSYTCISKGIQPIFEILTSAGRCWEWAIW